MPQYMLLLHSDRPFPEMSSEEMQPLVARYRTWRESLRSEGKLVASNKLRSSGRVLRKNGSKPVVTDGPFAELREVIGGYFAITADNYDQAVEVATACPHMDFGTIEVREIEPVG